MMHVEVIPQKTDTKKKCGACDHKIFVRTRQVKGSLLSPNYNVSPKYWSNFLDFYF